MLGLTMTSHRKREREENDYYKIRYIDQNSKLKKKIYQNFKKIYQNFKNQILILINLENKRENYREINKKKFSD